MMSWVKTVVGKLFHRNQEALEKMTRTPVDLSRSSRELDHFGKALEVRRELDKSQLVNDVALRAARRKASTADLVASAANRALQLARENYG